LAAAVAVTAAVAVAAAVAVTAAVAITAAIATAAGVAAVSSDSMRGAHCCIKPSISSIIIFNRIVMAVASSSLSGTLVCSHAYTCPHSLPFIIVLLHSSSSNFSTCGTSSSSRRRRSCNGLNTPPDNIPHEMDSHEIFPHVTKNLPPKTVVVLIP
jgi:hypothetical protein